MADIKLKTRLFNRYNDSRITDTTVLGKGEIHFIPVEIPVGSTGETTTAVLMKVGDGATEYANLNFVAARAADVYDWAKAANKPAYEAKEIVGIDAYIAGKIKDTDTTYSFTEIDGKLVIKSKEKGGEFVDCAEIDFVNPTELAAVIKAETDRALAAEAALSENIALEAQTARAAEQANATAIANEVTRATGAEAALSTSITAETERATAAEAKALSDAKEYVDEEDVFVTDILTVNALGGIAAGTDLNNLTTHEVLKKLLYPYVAQTVTNVSRTPNATVLEKGNDQVITAVSAKVTKKSEKIAKVELLKGSDVIATKEGAEVENGGTITFSGLNVEVPSSNVVLTVKATDTTGNAVTASTANWNFVYPYYIGTCAEGAEINEALVEGLATKKIEAKGNKSFAFTTDYECFVFAYPKAHGVLKSILDPNNFEILGSFTRHEVSVTGLDGTAQTYYVYVNGASTVSNFTVNFKY